MVHHLSKTKLDFRPAIRLIIFLLHIKTIGLQNKRVLGLRGRMFDGFVELKRLVPTSPTRDTTYQPN